MRATKGAFAALMAVASLAACSKQDQTAMSSDARDAAQSTGAEVSKVGHDADVRRAGSDLRQMGHVAAQDLRKGAAEAKAATNSAVSDAQRAAHHAGEQQDQGERDKSSSG